MRQLFAEPSARHKRGSVALVSTFQIDASWLFACDRSRTTQERFHAASGDVEVPMLSGTVALYAKGNGSQAITLPYVSPWMGLLIVLPEEGRLAEVAQSITPRALNRILIDVNRPRGAARIKLPKLEFASTFDPKRNPESSATELRVDRPFLFFVTDAPTGQILLAGRGDDPSIPGE